MSGDKKRILIVEDDAFIRDIYEVKFSQEGFDVVVAEDGIIAMKKLEKEVPDIILLDIIMPNMDGSQVFKKIKSIDILKNIPIIMLTNISKDKEDVVNNIENGADGYLIKSHFTPSEVVLKVKTLLKMQKLV
ncbi:MAG: response regulator [Candidatus Moranbacteria bacterium]|nr:response regulator [Candidatus Moranbacteria bacterium]